MTEWLSDWVTKWPSDRVTGWPGDQVTGWPGDRVTEWLSDQATKWPSDQVTGWQEALQTIDRMVYLGLSEIFIFAFHHLFEETFENDFWKNISGNQYLAHSEEKK